MGSAVVPSVGKLFTVRQYSVFTVLAISKVKIFLPVLMQVINLRQFSHILFLALAVVKQKMLWIKRRKIFQVRNCFHWLVGNHFFSAFLISWKLFTTKNLTRCISVFLSQFNALKILKKHRTMMRYHPPLNNSSVTPLSFADESHTTDLTQLCYIIGLLFRKVENRCLFHILCWSRRFSR